MKLQTKTLLQSILKRFATRILQKFHPDVIAITGSIGKTSSKDAIYEVMSSLMETRKTTGNMNNEIGTPLTILGVDSVKKIFSILIKTFFSKKYPKCLVLEMGADRFGDIKYLTSFIKPKIAVVTRVASSHLEFFKDLDGVAEEKSELVKSLGEDGVAILNYDDDRVRAMSELTNASVLTYGTKKGADVLASKIKTTREGLVFEVKYKKEKEIFKIPVIGKHYVYSALSAIACGIVYNMTLKDVGSALKKYKTPENRTSLVNGINNTIIISDIYNANPESMMAGVDVLIDIAKNEKGKGKKIAVLGDMLELGEKSEELHIMIGDYIKDKVDASILVGNEMEIVYGELSREFDDVYWFLDSESASKKIGDFIDEGDIILVKGSHGMHMEKIVEKLKL